KFHDALIEQSNQESSENGDDSFVADFVIMTEVLAGLLKCLTDVLFEKA
ncbi:MAG: recombination-associated protein RdgC, partial [Gammaproteobacteria bacterium]|nr:recombination-associated protein RdgC [Gammaproteobacteria bacterium]